MFTELNRFLSRQNARKIGVVSIYSSAFSRLRLVVGFFYGVPNSSMLGSGYQKSESGSLEGFGYNPQSVYLEHIVSHARELASEAEWREPCKHCDRCSDGRSTPVDSF